MSEKTIILQGKYEKSLVHIRELEQEKKELQEKNQNLQDSTKITDKAARNLCISILNKKPAQPKENNSDKKKKNETSKEINLNSLDLKDLLEKAQEGFENYVKDRTNLLETINQRNRDRSREKAELDEKVKKNEEKLNEFKAKSDEAANEKVEEMANAILEITESIPGIKKSEVEKILKDKNFDSMKLRGLLSKFTSFDAEKSDKLDGTVSAATKDIRKNENRKANMRRPEPGVRHSGRSDSSSADRFSRIRTEAKKNNASNNKPTEDNHSATEENTQKEEKVPEEITYTEDNLQSVCDTMTVKQKQFIETMGKTGLSELSELAAEGEKLFPGIAGKGKSVFSMASRDLVDEAGDSLPYLLDITEIKGLPGLGAAIYLYKLSEEGKLVYKHLTKEEPAESEYDIIVREHTTPKHGYGIKRTAQMLEETEWVKSKGGVINYHTRRDNPYKIPNGQEYIPDIIITFPDGSGFIEYETGDCTDKDFIAKCVKITYFSPKIYVIVPNNTVREKTIEKIYKWRDYIADNPDEYMYKDKAYVYVQTFKAIKESSENKKLDWGTKIQVSKPKKKAETDPA